MGQSKLMDCLIEIISHLIPAYLEFPKRAGWDDAFATMATCQDDTLLDDTSTTAWDDDEWAC
ncbi:MAG: hypothetical protein ACHWZW_18660 [Spirulina sp.]